ncbi:hypothetical protein MVEN_00923700 [Mycena venus]|uniref:F-box domain-containing protein n=1 Tax=Mycena venus TaxID=2733690 RepID=A0A8H7CZH3_9AGAR|nr:hypothetical protein MVEN_00923700 [Mycena venus]
MAVFQDLDEDILLGVLKISDVYTVLSASRVNKLIHTLALSKPLWVALVEDLIARCLLDAFSDPDFMDYSAPELREVVKRVMCGPTWTEDGSTPVIHRQLSVESSDIIPNKTGSSWPAYVRLLPGGRFFTLEIYDGRLECWSVATGRCVWNYSQERRTGYVVDVLDGGMTARFLLPGTLKDSFSIVQVDLMTGVSYEVFRMPRKDEIRWWTDSDALLSGDFVILTVHIHGSWVVLLINWKEGMYVNFHQTLTVPGMAVVLGHVILTTATLDPPYRPVLLVYTLASLAAYWRPLADWCPLSIPAFDLHRIQQGCGIVPALVENPGATEGWQVAAEGVRLASQGMRLAIRESPLRRETYALTFVICERGTFPPWDMCSINRYGFSPDPGAILVTYRISLSQHGLQLVQTSAVPTVPTCKARDVSYARYSVVKRRIEDIDLHRQEGAEKRRLGPMAYESVHLSPSSGAVTALLDSSVSVSYYA